jgi:hypothetical protein
MGVGDFLDVDDGNPFPVPAAIIWIFGFGFVPNGEDEAVGLFKVCGEPVFAVSFELVDACLGKVSEVFQAARRFEFRDSGFETLGPNKPELLLSLFSLVASFSSLLFLYRTCIASAGFFRFFLTYPVKEIFQILSLRRTALAP